jgi:cell division protein FtsA
MKQILGLDLGNQNFRLVLGTQTKNFKPKIICVLERPSEGISKGSIVDFENFVKSLRKTLEEFKRIVGRLPKSVIVNVLGQHFSVKIGRGAAPISRADGEISDTDTGQVLEKTKNISVSPNKTILHVISREYKVDDLEGIKDPIGMHGIRLEAESLLVEVFNPNVKTIKKAFDELGYKVEDMVFSPLASAWVGLSKKQEEVGTAIIDLGSENTNLSVYEDGKILTTTSFPVGANHITHDIAICLKTSLDIAEKIKLSYGCALASEVSRKDTIDLSKISRELDTEISKKYLAEIIEARLEEIFDFVAEELKKIGRQGKLPGGLVLVGGGAKMPQIVDFAKAYLKLPVRIGHPVKLELEDTTEDIMEIIDDPAFSVACGLFYWQLNNINSGKISMPSPFLSKLKKIAKIFVP